MLPTDFELGDTGHTATHNATNAAVNAAVRAAWIAGYREAPTPVMATPPDVTVSTSQSAFGYDHNLPGNALVLGAQVGFDAGDATFLYAENITPLDTDQFAPWALEFITDAPLFNLRVRGVGQTITILIDGQIADAAEAIPGGGANQYIEVDNTTRAMRHYRFESGDLRPAALIMGNSADSIITPGVTGPRVAVVGDSYVEGTGATTRTTAFPWRLGQLMGWSDLWQSGSGGTGYLATSDDRVKYRDRIDNDVLDHDPHLVIVCGGRNDNSGFSDAAVGAEALLLFQHIQAAGAELVVVGPMASGDADSTFESLRDAISAAADTVGALFLDPLADPVLFTGTGNAGATTGTGNADVLTDADEVHPTQLGHEAIARWVAARIAQAWRP